MLTRVVAGGPSGLWGVITRLTACRWRRRAAMSARSVFSASPFGDHLSEEEFAFCLLLIAAHL